MGLLATYDKKAEVEIYSRELIRRHGNKAIINVPTAQEWERKGKARIVKIIHKTGEIIEDRTNQVEKIKKYEIDPGFLQTNMIEKYDQFKIYHFLNRQKNGGTALLVFNHGLGDFINFMPLFDTLQNALPNWDLHLGFDVVRDFGPLHPKSFAMLEPAIVYAEKFDYVFKLEYPEPNESQGSKPEFCNIREIGLPYYKWEPCSWVEKNPIPNNKLIGLSFWGNTGTGLKTPTENIAKKIWRDIIGAGYEPFEIHMMPDFINDNAKVPFAYAREHNSLRFEKPDLQRMMEKIMECRFFIGVDAGPLYLALLLLGINRCAGLQKYKRIEKYFPCNNFTITKCDYYRPGQIVEVIEALEKRNRK